jgi:hypothetical protein
MVGLKALFAENNMAFDSDNKSISNFLSIKEQTRGLKQMLLNVTQVNATNRDRKDPLNQSAVSQSVGKQSKSWLSGASTGTAGGNNQVKANLGRASQGTTWRVHHEGFGREGDNSLRCQRMEGVVMRRRIEEFIRIMRWLLVTLESQNIQR